ncbi:DUF6193 family natural product biosynthesis protein [Micromonospora sp. NIE79]|uniref:DUF6193 family natural product biosynthesis protein n=1 Tax=Micromonospora trifolii TaxID=2911208 RepID=A0ABS9MYR2_9ACTN|nr:DUF6193 family natural product biosynthesis protein [Micromonospora trifolii]MCG5442703.1 DUF6193 family natural product biosynthesis protein [Micromonospora trifolii]
MGSLSAILQTGFAGVAPLRRALPESAPGWRFVGARVQDGERTATALMGGGERVFLMQFWARGVCLARGDTDDLHAVAGAMRAWQSGSRLRELGHEWPFVAFSPLASAHERGEGAEYTWRQYHRNTWRASHLLRLHSFITVAIHEPRLRRLMPFTSHGTLGFSRTVGYPYSGDCPWVEPLDGDRYRVTAADRRHEWGTADAARCVALVLAGLTD